MRWIQNTMQSQQEKNQNNYKLNSLIKLVLQTESISVIAPRDVIIQRTDRIVLLQPSNQWVSEMFNFDYNATIQHAMLIFNKSIKNVALRTQYLERNNFLFFNKLFNIIHPSSSSKLLYINRTNFQRLFWTLIKIAEWWRFECFIEKKRKRAFKLFNTQSHRILKVHVHMFTVQSNKKSI